MPSMNRPTIRTRAASCLAAAALMAGVALAAQPIAGATPRGFSNCASSSTAIGTFAKCCADFGGTVVTVPATNDSSAHNTCTFPPQPAAQEGSAPPRPEVVTQVVPPPAAQEGPGPVITPIPMAPNSGRG